MLLKEKNIKKIDSNKILLNAYYVFDRYEKALGLKFDAYYDVGNGFQDAYHGGRLEERKFAEKVKKHINNSYKDMLHFDGDDDYIMGSESLWNIDDENERLNVYATNIYSFARSIKYPVFFQVAEEDYLFLNEVNFLDFEKDKEGEFAKNKIKELDDYIFKNMPNDEKYYHYIESGKSKMSF